MAGKTMSKTTINCRGLEALDEVARQLVEYAGNKRVWLFEGQLGAGKTTIIKAVCKYLGVQDTVNSPTFSIINEYQNNMGEKLYHFDFYRIDDEEEALDIGVLEYFDSGAYCFIEWPSKIKQILPETTVNINISVQGKEQRIIELTRHE